MSKERPEQFSFTKEIKSSNDILNARNEVQNSSRLLGFKKTQMTVLTAASSDVLRVFLKSAEDITTEISSINDANATGIKLQVTGKLTDISGMSRDITEVRQELEQRLNKIKDIFSDFDLSLNGSDTVTLTLQHRIPISKERKYPKNN